MARLEELVRSENMVSESDLEKAIALSRAEGRPLAEVLVDRGFVDEESLLRALAKHGGLSFVVLGDMSLDEAAVRSVPAKLASHYGVIPVRIEGNILTLALSSPFDMSAVEDIETNLGLHVERVLACRRDIMDALQKYYGVGADTVERILATDSETRVMPVGEEAHDLEKMAQDASVVRLVNQILQEAIDDRATDIHFEIYRDGVALRRRIDGMLYETSVPANMKLLYPAIVSRIKLMSGLNIVERRLPQDGRSRVSIGRKEYDLRVSAVPAMHGEDIVIRILPSTMLFDIKKLGFTSGHLDVFESLIAKPHGILFVTGPTGSGKSTTLYACLSRLNTREHKIITIEDPVEYELRGITQTQVNPKVGLTFARALRSMLRHDPDIMMVGEVRDRETAEIAVQTAMTGHLVLSTLHTNDAAGAAVRLGDMGIEPFLITSTVLAFVAQRLVRVLCPRCRERMEAGGKVSFRPVGCKACGRSGYSGRMAVVEIVTMESQIQQAIMARASARTIREQADALGMRTLAQDGAEKVAAGLTTQEELLRVIMM